MLKLSYIEFFLRLIPESLLVIFAIYAFSKTKVNRDKYLITSILYAIIIFIIRGLPIHFGVHTVLGIIALILLTININKIDVVKAISASIITIILEFLFEGVNVLIIQAVGADISIVFENKILKTIAGIPSLLLLGCVSGLFYFIMRRRNELKDVSDK